MPNSHPFKKNFLVKQTQFFSILIHIVPPRKCNFFYLCNYRVNKYLTACLLQKSQSVIQSRVNKSYPVRARHCRVTWFLTSSHGETYKFSYRAILIISSPRALPRRLEGAPPDANGAGEALNSRVPNSRPPPAPPGTPSTGTWCDVKTRIQCTARGVPHS